MSLAMHHDQISRMMRLLISIVFCLSAACLPSKSQAHDLKKLTPEFVSEPGCPIHFVGAVSELELSPSGAPIAARHYVDYRNDGDRPIAAVRFRIGYSDVSGNMYRPYLNGDDSRMLQPGEQASVRFRGDKIYPRTVGVKLRVLQVTFADGRLWQSVKVTNSSNKQEHDHAPLVLEKGGSHFDDTFAPSDRAQSHDGANSLRGMEPTSTASLPQMPILPTQTATLPPQTPTRTAQTATQPPQTLTPQMATPPPQAPAPPPAGPSELTVIPKAAEPALLDQPTTTAPAAQMPSSGSGDRTVEQKILEFARSKIGMQVGRGECGDFGMEAVKTAGAKPPSYNAKLDEWSWGKLVKDPRDAQPGDIIQFRNAHFDFYKQRDEGLMHFTQHTTQIAPQHTSIISKNLGNGKFLVLDQHVDGRKTVKERELDLTAQTQGSVKIYRPEETPVEPLTLVPQVYHSEKRPAVQKPAGTPK